MHGDGHGRLSLVPNENGHEDYPKTMQADQNMSLNDVVHFGGL
jgi:hypothetical protein